MGYAGVSAMLSAFITSPFAGALLGLESAQDAPGGGRPISGCCFPACWHRPWQRWFSSR